MKIENWKVNTFQFQEVPLTVIIINDSFCYYFSEDAG